MGGILVRHISAEHARLLLIYLRQHFDARGDGLVYFESQGTHKDDVYIEWYTSVVLLSDHAIGVLDRAKAYCSLYELFAGTPASSLPMGG